MKGIVKSKQEVAQGTLQVTFQLSEPVTFKPGQYVFVNLPQLLYPDERGARRQFSINNSPNESNILTITTRLSDSGFKKTLKELAVGSSVELGPVAGVFILPEDTSQPLVLIAGGIGITPYMSMLAYIGETKKPYKVTLVYSNRNQSSTAFLNEVQEFAKNLPDFKLILTMTEDNGWTGERRKIDAGFIKEFFPNVNENLYMVVGPPGMVDAIRRVLSEVGVKEESIKFENFTGY